MNMFMKAAQLQYRYDSRRGSLCTEDLFNLPLKSRDGFDLDTVAKGINKALKEEQEESFVETSGNPIQELLEGKLEVLKAVIKWRQEQNAMRERLKLQTQKRDKLRRAISEAESRELSSASQDDLKKMLAEVEQELAAV